MRAAVLANLIVLGIGLDACGRGDAPARDARPRPAVTQARAPAHDTMRNTQTRAYPDLVPAALATSVPLPASDTPPQMRNRRLPFRYPSVLYPRRVQGNVTLRLWVDSTGRVRAESTRVAESSGARLLDSAAVAGSARLEFTPARHDGRPVAAPLLFPVHFRHPAAGVAKRP